MPRKSKDPIRAARLKLIAAIIAMTPEEAQGVLDVLTVVAAKPVVVAVPKLAKAPVAKPVVAKVKKAKAKSTKVATRSAAVKSADVIPPFTGGTSSAEV
jgi:hypothetical protein